ncbi:MAG TPA: hypothetical protein VN685_00500 [Rhizomicrobium sp.]|jgi:hypothetical protein|nr:hypothetical protein [Rhizomicrobium sp.]
MIATKLRAVATALLLTTGAVAGGVMVSSLPASAQNAVRPVVGKPLQEAQALAAQKNYKGAMAKIAEAEAAPGKTEAETKIINQMKEYVASVSGDTSTAGGAKTKFANDYNAKNYKGVIADAEALKKLGALDTASTKVVAQAYYLDGDKQGCLKYIKSNLSNPDDETLALQLRCAYDANDEATERQALDLLIAHTGKAEYWNDLLKMSERAQGMRDHDTLDIYRLKLLTGTISGKDEYTTLAQLAVQLGFPSEAVAVITKAQAANLMKDDRGNKLLALAKSQAAADQANMAKNIAAAGAQPNGDALVKIGEDQWGMGNSKEAIGTIQNGMKKPLTDKNGAQVRLGMAYLGAGQKADAEKTFDAVKGPDTDKSVQIAHLWALYARH